MIDRFMTSLIFNTGIVVKLAALRRRIRANQDRNVFS